MSSETLQIAFLGLLIDATIGYPEVIFRAIGHPVTWMGALIKKIDRRFNREEWPRAARRLAGAAAIACLVAIAAGAGYLLQTTLSRFHFGDIVVATAASTLFASRSLYRHVKDVADALECGSVEDGRRAVSKIVGRDANALDEHGVARAAIESLAENASDGVVAPILWFILLGLPGLAAYKAINTADSMIGHRTPRHEAFGWAAARLDDAVNLPASRLTAILLALAGLARTGALAGAVKAIILDAPRHRSPNAGYPEAAMAGALGLRLAGPRSYGGVAAQDAFMGNGRLEATGEDIFRALMLARVAWGIMLAAIAVPALLNVLF